MTLRLSFALLFVALSAPAFANKLGPIGTQVKALSGWGSNCPRLDHMMGGDWDGPLRFSVMQVVNTRVLIISGTFTAGDSDRLSTFLSTAGHISEVWLDSGGGNAEEGPKVGEVLRTKMLATRVANGYACISSCSMAFLGGVLRYIDDGAIYGIHTFYDEDQLGQITNLKSLNAQKNSLHEREQSNAILAGKIQRYGQKMGISRDFFPDVMFKQRSLVFVSDAEILAMRKAMSVAHTSESAIAYIKRLQSDGIISFSDDDDLRRRQIDHVFNFMLEQHSPDEIDAFISPMLQTFECIDRQQLNKYNIINVVQRRAGAGSH